MGLLERDEGTSMVAVETERSGWIQEMGSVGLGDRRRGRERNTSRMTFSRICLGKVDDASNWDGARWRKMKFGGMERLITWL